jgi:hypothetical protein
LTGWQILARPALPHQESLQLDKEIDSIAYDPPKAALPVCEDISLIKSSAWQILALAQLFPQGNNQQPEELHLLAEMKVSLPGEACPGVSNIDSMGVNLPHTCQ